jgi:hypothetical protein
MTYENINPGAEVSEENWLDLLMLAEHSTYSPQVYRHLEEYFEKRGHSDLADQVYIAQKRRERREILEWYSITWWWSLFLDLFIRYGRSPDLAFLYSLFVVVFGSIVFWRKDGMRPTASDAPPQIKTPSHIPKTLPRWMRMQMMASQTKSNALVDYNPIWYSLDLFISIVDLRMAEDWEPSPERQWARAYMRIHIILGWVLIPIGLLALTGVIR